MFELKPILSALLRHKSRTLLIVMQIAITLAVVVNSVSIIHNRMSKMDRQSGLAENELLTLNVSAFGKNYNVEQNIRADIDMIRHMDGVIDAVAINQVPLSGSGDSFMVASSQENYDSRVNVGIGSFAADSHIVNTLGVKLVAGRMFTEEEVEYTDTSPNASVVLITKALADRLFPGQDAVGKTLFAGNIKPQIIGVIERMSGSWVSWPNFEYNVISPFVRLSQFKRILIRTEPEVRNEIAANIEKLLLARNPERVIFSVRTFDELRTRSYSNDRAMSNILWVVVLLLITITALGIVGLASFSVNQRIKQIGTRRALGASKLAIQRYFVTEIMIITLLGVTIGSALAVAFNIYLVDSFQLSAIEWHYLPIGMMIMLITGVIAVWLPAKRASSISPAVATQSI